jgi:hypothetical protein
MGMYEVQPTLASGSKAVYKNSNGQYLYYWPEYTDWRIGADYKKAEAWMESTSNTNTTCPQDSSGWHEVDFDGTFTGNISVQVAAGTCALSRCRIANACSLCHTRCHNQNMSRIQYTET